MNNQVSTQACRQTNIQRYKSTQKQITDLVSFFREKETLAQAGGFLQRQMSNVARMFNMGNTVMSEVKHRIVHIDLKGAPPKIDYFRQVFPMFRSWGATDLVLEYEDMFPYSAKLSDIHADNAYTPQQIVEISQLAKENNLGIIPLVQTIGHLEFVLKYKKYTHLRETPESPQSINIGLNESIGLVHTMIDQVLAAHPDCHYFHIGADEVLHIGESDEANRIMKAHSLGKSGIFLRHVTAMASYVQQKYPHVQVLIWDDMLRKMTLKTIQV